MDLVKMLVSQLGVSDGQARGGAGLLFNLARERLGADEFAQITQAVPGVAALISAAPDAGGGGMAGLLGKALGGKAGDLAALAGGFSRLGLDVGMAQKFVPVIMGYLQQQGAQGAVAALQRLLNSP